MTQIQHELENDSSEEHNENQEMKMEVEISQHSLEDLKQNEHSSDDCGDTEEDQDILSEMEDDPVYKELEKYKDLKFTRSKFAEKLELWKKDPTIFWVKNKEEFPLLSRLWRRVGTIKASSASAERVFSLGGFLLTARRWNMKPETLTSIVMLHQWEKNGFINIIKRNNIY